MSGETKVVEPTKVVRKVIELPDDLNPDVEELKCVNCGRFLGLVALVEGTVCIKCRRCKIWSVIDVHMEKVDK